MHCMLPSRGRRAENSSQLQEATLATNKYFQLENETDSFTALESE